MKDMFDKIPGSIKEAVKEAARLAVLAFISYVVAFGLKYVAGLPETQTTMILTFLLRAFDKWLHEHGKETDNTNLQGGITRF